MNSLAEFLETLSPAFDLITHIVSYRLFGIPVYLILLNLLFVGVVVHFIGTGAPGLSSTVSSASAEIKSRREARAEKKLKHSKRGKHAK